MRNPARTGILALLLAAALGLSAALAAAAIVPLEEPPPAFETPVTVDTGPEGMPLEAVLRAMVESIGWVPLLRDIPEENVVVHFEKLPFSEAWRLLLSVYADGIGYVPLSGGILVAAPEEVIRERFGLEPAEPAEPAEVAAEEGEPEPPRLYTLRLRRADPDLLERAAKLFPEDVTYVLVPERRTLVLRATPAAYQELVAVLERTGLYQPAAAPAAEEEPGEEAPARAHFLDVPNLPEDVLAALEELYPEYDLTYVASTGKLVVHDAGEEGLAEVAATLEELLGGAAAEEEAPEVPERVVESRTYHLEALDVEQATQVVRFLAPEARVSPVPGARALLVEATTEEHARIAAELEQLEQRLLAERVAKAAAEAKAAAARETRVYQTGDPEGTATLLRETFGEKIKVVLVPRGVAVSAEPETLAEVEDFLASAVGEVRRAEPGRRDDAPTVWRFYHVDYASGEELIQLFTATKDDLDPPLTVDLKYNDRTGEMLVQGGEEDVERALELLRALDRPRPQVEVKVRIYQVDRSYARSLGVNLEALLQPFSLSAGSGGLSAAYALGESALNAVVATLDSLESEGAAKTLVDTRFVTTDGETVTLNSGGQLVALQTAATSEQNGGAAQNPGVTISYGLVVELTPRVALSNRQIALELDTSLGSRPVEGAGGTIDVPKQQFTNKVRLDEGKAVVLGGLVTTTDSTTHNSSPLISWLPLVGDLLGSDKADSSRSELLFIVSGRILDDGAPAIDEGDLEAPAVEPVAPVRPPARDAVRPLPPGVKLSLRKTGAAPAAWTFALRNLDLPGEICLDRVEAVDAAGQRLEGYLQLRLEGQHCAPTDGTVLATYTVPRGQPVRLELWLRDDAGRLYHHAEEVE